MCQKLKIVRWSQLSENKSSPALNWKKKTTQRSVCHSGLSGILHSSLINTFCMWPVKNSRSCWHQQSRPVCVCVCVRARLKNKQFTSISIDNYMPFTMSEIHISGHICLYNVSSKCNLTSMPFHSDWLFFLNFKCILLNPISHKDVSPVNQFLMDKIKSELCQRK